MRGQAVKDAPAGKTIKITGTIQAASASGNNGELEITKDLTIKPNGSSATLDANSSALGSNAHRIFKVTGGNFKLYNMVLQSGNAGENEGGGIYVSGGELVLSETTIKNCIAQDGGGIYLAGNGTAGSTMTGGKVSYKLATDTSAAKGGGIYIEESASFTMQNGNINNNKVDTTSTEDGGGVYVRGQGSGSGTHASFTLNGGTIGDNQAGFGGGVMANAGGKFTMNNGTMSGNRANYGGGVRVGTLGDFTMKNGTITDNIAYQNGKAISVQTNSTFNWEGGSITGHTVGSGDVIHRDGGKVNNPHNYTAS